MENNKIEIKNILNTYLVMLLSMYYKTFWNKNYLYYINIYIIIYNDNADMVEW